MEEKCYSSVYIVHRLIQSNIYLELYNITSNWPKRNKLYFRKWE